jgi:hypothetical protein
MNPSEIKELLIRSLDQEASTEDIPRKLEEAGVSFEFKHGFSERVSDRIFSAGEIVSREVDFVKNLNYIFYRIAFTGVAAIVVLLISIFLMEGSLSLDSFLGLSDTDGESIVCLLTGN